MVGAAGALVAVVADVLIALAVVFTAAVALAAFLTEHVRIIAVAVSAVHTVQVLLFQAVVAVDVAARSASAPALVKGRDTFVTVVAVYLHTVVFCDAFGAGPAGRAKLVLIP